ncbi:PREDICTED: dermatopontin-like isoform X2 [Acropora digitifera]|uniref:dermatopontin-like isoform X2 n=1 Tax=Acropora digitifera TaxID=70779 RepID=UPI00077AED45|nr:PREDICTED: dermatopontin-like isoform X2 [Acropora digitifera]
MTMKGSKLALFLLLVVTLEILLFTGSDGNGGWKRRRRRRPRCRWSRPSYPRWDNNWRQDFNVRCGNSYSISVWQSKYRHCWGDRIHHFQCKYGPFYYQFFHCSTTYYVNDYDRPLSFRCPHNGVITAVRSTYSYGAKDRRFAFRCCHRHGYIAHSCHHTHKKNNWHQPLRYVVPYGYYLVGASSEHRNSKQDRTWKFEICKFG